MKAAPAVNHAIGAVAVRLGVSVRALRLYEAEGLIALRRTEAGQRVYGEPDVARVRQILALKQAGYTLGQIAHLLSQRTIDPASLIDIQIEALCRQKSAIDRTLASLQGVRLHLVGGERLGIDDYCELIASGESVMTEDAWKQVWDKYYTPEEQERWRTAKLQFSAADRVETERAWSDLVGRIDAAIANGVDPCTARGAALAAEWRDLQQPLIDKIGGLTWNSSARMFQDIDTWQTDAVKSPFSAEVYRFIVTASNSVRTVMPPQGGGA